jgi:hypothetical protein
MSVPTHAIIAPSIAALRLQIDSPHGGDMEIVVYHLSKPQQLPRGRVRAHVGAWAVVALEGAPERAGIGGKINMTSSEHEQPIDLWAERRGDVAVLVGQLSPSEALEVLSRVVMDATDSAMLAPVLIGCIRGVVERGGAAGENQMSASEGAYHDMKSHSPDLGDK